MGCGASRAVRALDEPPLRPPADDWEVRLARSSLLSPVEAEAPTASSREDLFSGGREAPAETWCAQTPSGEERWPVSARARSVDAAEAGPAGVLAAGGVRDMLGNPLCVSSEWQGTLLSVSRKPSRPATPSASGLLTQGVIGAGAARSRASLARSDAGARALSRPTTAGSHALDWMIETGSGTPPPTAGSAMNHDVHGWGTLPGDEDERASLTDCMCLSSPLMSGLGGQVQMLVLDGPSAPPPLGASVHGEDKRGDSQCKSATTTTAVEGLTDAASPALAPESSHTNFLPHALPLPGRDIVCALSLRGATSDAISLSLSAFVREPASSLGTALRQLGPTDGVLVFQLQMAMAADEADCTPGRLQVGPITGVGASLGACAEAGHAGLITSPPRTPGQCAASFSASTATAAAPVASAANAAYSISTSNGATCTGRTAVHYRDVYTGTSVCYDVVALTPSHAYIFRLRAQLCSSLKSRTRRDGWSEWAYERFACDCAPPQAPAPLQLTANGATPRSLRVLCTEIHRINGDHVRSVRLELQSGPPGNEETIYRSFTGIAAGERSVELNVTDLTPRTQYRLRARAANTKGEGPWSRPVSLTTLGESLPVMSPPMALRRGSCELTITWSQPLGMEGGDGDHTFELEMTGAVTAGTAALSCGVAPLEVGADSATAWRPVYRGVGTQCVVRNLRPATVHRFRIRCVRCANSTHKREDRVGGRAGDSAAESSPADFDDDGVIALTEWSEPLAITTGASVPAAPLPPAVLGRAVEGAEVAWIAPDPHGSTIVKHELRIEREGSTMCGMRRNHSASSAAHGTDAHTRTRRECVSASGAECGQVSIVTAVALPDVGAGGTRVVARLECSFLPAGSRLRLSARATNAIGAGPWSEASFVEVEARPLGAPTEVTQDERHASVITLRWLPPETNGTPLTTAEVAMVLLGPCEAPAERLKGIAAPIDDGEIAAAAHSPVHPTGGMSKVVVEASTASGRACDSLSARSFGASCIVAPPPEASEEWRVVWTGKSSAEGARGCARLKDLRSGCAYACRVRVHNTLCEGAWSEPVVVYTVSGTLSTPGVPIVISKTSTTMHLRWAAAYRAGGRTGGAGDAAGDVTRPHGEGVSAAVSPNTKRSQSRNTSRWQLQMNGGVRVKYNSNGLSAGRGALDDGGLFSSGCDFSSGLLPVTLHRSHLRAAEGDRGGATRLRAVGEKGQRLRPPQGQALRHRLPPMLNGSALTSGASTSREKETNSAAQQSQRPTGHTSAGEHKSSSTSSGLFGGRASLSITEEVVVEEDIREDIDEVPEDFLMDFSAGSPNMESLGCRSSSFLGHSPWPERGFWPSRDVASLGRTPTDTMPPEVVQEEEFEEPLIVAGAVESDGSPAGDTTRMRNETLVLGSPDERSDASNDGGGRRQSNDSEGALGPLSPPSALMPAQHGQTVKNQKSDAEEDVGSNTDQDFITLYEGPAHDFTVASLAPACRYSFRVRYISESGAMTEWSPLLTVETDTADSSHRITFDQIECFEVLGEGGFSVVHRGRYKGQAVAVKRLKYQHLNEDLMSNFNQELAILSRVRHRNVVAFVGAVTEQPNLCVVMEYMEAGTLHDAIHKKAMQLTLPKLLEVALDVANGCHYLHRQKPMIVHRDLKSQNILLTKDGRCKIADFGLSKIFQNEVAGMTGQIGTPGWTAPEVYKHGSYDQKVDVYSFGIVLAECLSCEKPYTGMDAMQVAFATVYRNKRPALPPTTPPAIDKLTRLCWDADPKKRPVFAKIIEQLQGFKRAMIMNGGMVGVNSIVAVGLGSERDSPARAESRGSNFRSSSGVISSSSEILRNGRISNESPQRIPSAHRAVRKSVFPARGAQINEDSEASSSTRTVSNGNNSAAKSTSSSLGGGGGPSPSGLRPTRDGSRLGAQTNNSLPARSVLGGGGQSASQTKSTSSTMPENRRGSATRRPA